LAGMGGAGVVDCRTGVLDGGVAGGSCGGVKLEF
jgi:hypothetical protein